MLRALLLLLTPSAAAFQWSFSEPGLRRLALVPLVLLLAQFAFLRLCS